MSSILKALRKLEEEKAALGESRIDLARDILKRSAPRRDTSGPLIFKTIFFGVLACAIIAVLWMVFLMPTTQETARTLPAPADGIVAAPSGQQRLQPPPVTRSESGENASPAPAKQNHPDQIDRPVSAIRPAAKTPDTVVSHSTGQIQSGRNVEKVAEQPAQRVPSPAASDRSAQQKATPAKSDTHAVVTAAGQEDAASPSPSTGTPQQTALPQNTPSGHELTTDEAVRSAPDAQLAAAQGGDDVRTKSLESPVADAPAVHNEPATSTVSVSEEVIETEPIAAAQATQEPLPQENKPVGLPELQINAIAFKDQPGERLAVINNLPVMEGTTIEGVRIVEILKDGVRFSWQGTEFVLPIAD